jgi:hypothetical protein
MMGCESLIVVKIGTREIRDGEETCTGTTVAQLYPIVLECKNGVTCGIIPSIGSNVNKNENGLPFGLFDFELKKRLTI